MKEKIKLALKNRYKNMGFGDKAIESVAEYLSGSIKEESEIETAIGGVEPILKAFQSESDKIRTEKANAEKRLSEIEARIKGLGGAGNAKPGEESGEEDEDKDTPAWAKAMIKAMKEQSERLEKLESGKLSESRKQQLDGIIGQLPEALRKPYQRIRLDGMNDEEFGALKDDIKQEIEGILAESKAKGAVFGIPLAGNGGEPGSGGKGKEATEKEIDAVLEGMNI